MTKISNTINSYKNYIMSKLIQDENIVRALTISEPNFLNNEYNVNYDEIPNSLLDKEIINKERNANDKTSEIIINNTIYANALRYTYIFPKIYISKVVDTQKTLIYYTVEYISNLSYAKSLVGKNKLLGGYIVRFRIFSHEGLSKTSYQTQRELFIADRIENFMFLPIGRHEHRSFDDIELKTISDFSLHEGMIAGVEMQFILSSFINDCEW